MNKLTELYRPVVHLVLSVLLLCCMLTQNVLAKGSHSRDTVFYRSVPSAAELGRHLFGPKTRGLVITQPQQIPKPQTAERSVGLPVLFHFGKTTLIESSKPYLDKVGELMQQPQYLRETLIIEGHTDAVGSEAHNAALSERRALAVKSYLMSQYNIDPLRLFPIGKGEMQLYLPVSA